MFLEKTLRENKKLIDYSIMLHQKGKILPDTYVLDVDTILKNAKTMLEEANKCGIKLYYMTKQIGRNPIIAKKLETLGFAGAVVVDYKEALIMIENNIKIGNVGHLVQVPKQILRKILMHKPEVITVFSSQIAVEINAICQELQLKQDIVLKVVDIDKDIIYDAQLGGFSLENLETEIAKLKKLKAINIVGVTSFPVLLLEKETSEIKTTPNYETLQSAIKILNANNINVSHVNMPSSTSTATISKLAKIGATHGEPGHGLTGTTPAHVTDNNELPAMVYVSEISHQFGKNSYCYGGGYYRRSLLKTALVNHELIETINPQNESIDYYIGLKGKFNYGDTVIMNFRTQIFVTRSQIALVEGLTTDTPHLLGVYTALGKCDE